MLKLEKIWRPLVYRQIDCISVPGYPYGSGSFIKVNLGQVEPDPIQYSQASGPSTKPGLNRDNRRKPNQRQPDRVRSGQPDAS